MKQNKDYTPSPSKSIEYVSINGKHYPLDESQTQVQYIGNWYEIMEDQEGKPYIMAGYRLQAIYLDLPSPSPSIPVKEDLLDITKGIWEPEYCLDGSVFIKNDIEQDEYIALLQGEESGNSLILENNAQAICTAVNNTYGQSINPESVPAMYRALKNNHEVLLRFYTSNMPQLHEEDLKDLRTAMADILSILQKATPNK